MEGFRGEKGLFVGVEDVGTLERGWDRWLRDCCWAEIVECGKS